MPTVLEDALGNIVVDERPGARLTVTISILTLT
jgi:hypothetical protein